MESIDLKIKAIIHQFNLNNFAFSRRIGVTSTTIDSIVNGRPQADGSRKRTKPGYDVLMSIINEFDINPDYLFGKSQHMLKPEVNTSNGTYAGMPQVISTNTNGDENIIFVSQKAQAGYLHGYGDMDFVENLPAFRLPILKEGTFRCFEVKGNSMYRTLCDGDLVVGSYVEDLQDIKSGRIYIVITKNDGIVIKRVINRIAERALLILKSDNKDYPTYTVQAEDIMEVWYVNLYASKQMAETVDIYERLDQLETEVTVLKSSLK